MDKRVLNLGCGNDFYGTDRIDLYKTPATTKVLNIDQEKLPYPNNYFDEIRANQILEHLKNVGNFIDEVYRVLKKDGKIYLRTDHAGFIFYYILKRKEHNRLLRRWYKKEAFKHNQGEDAHYHLFVASHLSALFRRFSEARISYFHANPNRLINLILKILPFRLGASQIEVIAIK